MAKPGPDDSSWGNLGVSTYSEVEQEVKILKTISQSEDENSCGSVFSFFLAFFRFVWVDGGFGAKRLFIISVHFKAHKQVFRIISIASKQSLPC